MKTTLPWLLQMEQSTQKKQFARLRHITMECSRIQKLVHKCLAVTVSVDRICTNEAETMLTVQVTCATWMN